MVSESEVREALKGMVVPEARNDLVSLGLVDEVEIKGARVLITISIPSAFSQIRERIEGEVVELVGHLPGVAEVSVDTPIKTMVDKKFLPGVKDVRKIVLVGSGKGGVGKSTVSVNLAIALARLGAKVGLLDGDIYGPNVPHMLALPYGVSPHASGDKMYPVEAFGLKVFSVGFFVKEGEPLIWRGPMLHGVMQQFLRDVDWGELDYLLVDLPPGTGDVQLSLTQMVSLAGGIIVSTPQLVAWSDAAKAVAMFNRMEVPIIGFIENMSTFHCPKCGKGSDIFGHGGVAKAAEQYDVPFLGEIPIDVRIRQAGDAGKPFVIAHPDSHEAQAFMSIAGLLMAKLDGAPH